MVPVLSAPLLVSVTVTKPPKQPEDPTPARTLQQWVHSDDVPKENNRARGQTRPGPSIFALSHNLARLCLGSRPFLSLTLAPASWESPSVV